MPNEQVLNEKKTVVEALKERFDKSIAGVFVDHCGLSVAEDTQLRNKLREAGVNYTVVKNTMTRFAVKGTSLEEIDPILNGPTALATSDTDLVAAAKVLVDYSKTNKNLQIKSGYIEGQVISIEEITRLAELPSKEVLIATVLGTMNAPIQGFVTVLQANISGLARTLNAIAEKKSA